MQNDMRAPRRARALIDRLRATKQLTDEGLCWLTNATDPFHDTQVRPCGYPDVNTTPTIVQCFTQTATLTTNNADSSANFDAHVFLYPITSYATNSAGVHGRIKVLPGNGGVSTATNLEPNLYGGFNAISVPAGADWLNRTGPLPYVTVGDTLGIPPGAMSGQSRVIAMGFEVVNTTPELYRGGSVTCYRSPSCHTQSRFFPAAASATYAIYSPPYDTFALPPSTQANAQLYPNSRTWGAEEGVYSISTLNNVENPFILQKANTAVGCQPFDKTSLTSGSTVFCTGSEDYWGFTTSTPGQAADCAFVLPFDVNGCVFTGLNPNTTLQITTKYYIERIPTVTQPDLLVLTRPPSPFDPMALDIYSRATQELPVACRVCENPLGEWFNDVMAAIAEYGPKVGAIFGPAGSAIGTAVGTLAHHARQANSNAIQNQNRQNVLRRGVAPMPPPRSSSLPQNRGPALIRGPRPPPRANPTAQRGRPRQNKQSKPPPKRN